MTHSLLTLLENGKFTKRFYEESHKKALEIIASGIDFKKPLTGNELQKLLEMSGFEIEESLSILENVDTNDNVDDDVFGFAAQQLLVELAEDSDKNQDKMFEIKKFLTYHTIYAEAMKDSPYDKALRIIAGEDPDEVNGTSSIIDDPVVVVQPSEPVIEFKDTVDLKYVNPIYKAPRSKLQKPAMYTGCKVIIEGKKISEFVYPRTWDENKFQDDQGFEHDTTKAHVIFKTEVPEIGDIAFTEGDYFLLGDKATLDLVLMHNLAFKNVTFYTTKFNNRKVETINVKRFSCGTLDKDISSIPYHVEIIYQDIKVNYQIDAIAKHYNVSHDKLVEKEVDLLKEIKITLDHPLNVAKSEWCYLLGEAGLTKSQFIA